MKWTGSDLYHTSRFPPLDTQLCALLLWAVVHHDPLYPGKLGSDLPVPIIPNCAVGSSRLQMQAMSLTPIIVY